MDFYYGEHLRLDWGFDNPNKTAALVACLMVVVHAIRFIGRKTLSLPLFFALFLGLGICLIHTYSRGGMIAAISGQLVYWLTRYRARPKLPPRRELRWGVSLILILGIYAALPQVNAVSRYQQGIHETDEEDRSVSNRLRIWKDVPRMMVDAPRGWGRQGAGKAWMLWYQPMDTRYRYRTLVNSHLTWLVELGWLGRFLYLTGWGLLLALGFARRKESDEERRSAAITIGVWVAFGVSAFFSSVAEAWVLWIVPVLCFGVQIFHAARKAPIKSIFREIRAEVIGVFTAALMSIGIIANMGQKAKINGPAVHFNGDQLFVGSPPYRNLLIAPDESVLGRHYSYSIRNHDEEGWCIIESVPKNFAPGVQRLIFSGKFPEGADSIPYFKGEMVFLNPLKMIDKKARQDQNLRIILGKLRNDPVAKFLRATSVAEENERVSFQSGKKIYLGDWVPTLYPATDRKTP